MRARKCAARSRTSSRKVHAPLGRVVEDEPRTVEDLLHPRQLHREAPLADLHQADALRVLLALLVLQACDDVVACRLPYDAIGRLGGRTLADSQIRDRAHDGSDRRPFDGIDHNGLAGSQRGRKHRGRGRTGGLGAIRVLWLRGDPRGPRPVMRDPRLVSRRRLARRFGIESQVRQQEVYVRPTGVNLTLTNGRSRPSCIRPLSLNRALATPVPGGSTKLNRCSSRVSWLRDLRENAVAPVETPLTTETPASRRRFSGSRCDRSPRARGRSRQTRATRARGRTSLPARRSGCCRSAFARHRSSARAPIAPRSRTIDASARRRRRSSSRSPPPERTLALSSRRRGSRVPATCWQHLGCRFAGLDERGRPTLERESDAAIGGRGGGVRVSRREVVCASSALPRSPPPSTFRSAAADSATEQSAGARLDAT